MKGKIKWFNHTKGFGFIECDDGGDDVFLHWNHVIDINHEPIEGDRVEFDVTSTPKGRQAKNVKFTLKTTLGLR